MRRREFITLLGGALTWSHTAKAEHAEKVPHKIGYLSSVGDANEAAPYLDAFLDGLRDLGYVKDQTIAIEYRFAAGHYDRFELLATELVGAKVDVLVADIVPGAIAAKRVTAKTPIVIVLGGDPVGAGVVDSLARPGGNVTGLSSMVVDLSAKQLQVFKEGVPNLVKVALLYNPRTPFPRYITEAQVAAKSLQLTVHLVEANSQNELDHAFSAIGELQVNGVLVAPDAILYNNRKRIAEFALAHRLPTIAWVRELAEAGTLMSYGASNSDAFRRAASYVDRILRGSSPATLPVEQPTKFEFVVNLKIAKALGLSMPPTLLARADEVIE